MNPTRASLALALLLLALSGGSGARAQEASPPRPSHIHSGDCDELGPIIQPLNSLTVPTGPVAGNRDAVVAETAFTVIPQSLDELLATDHAIKVHLSKEQIQVYFACGDIGGTLDANGALIVGMKELDNSGYAGIAYFAPGPNGTTSVSVLIAKVIPTADQGPAATPTAGSPLAGPTIAPGTAAQPALVDVGLSEFTIDMPTSLPAGPTRFRISNNGSVPHSFVIEGEGISKRLANTIQPGEASVLNADLEPGTYTVYCPVGEGAHRAKGMEVTLEVVGG